VRGPGERCDEAERPGSASDVGSALELVSRGAELGPTPEYVSAPGAPGSASANEAVTVVAAVRVSEQLGPLGVGQPVHPANADAESGAAVSVTEVPVSNHAVHSGLQVIPVGTEVTSPPPETRTSSGSPVITLAAAT
jgi:hypothetical protein